MKTIQSEVETSRIPAIRPGTDPTIPPELVVYVVLEHESLAAALRHATKALVSA